MPRHEMTDREWARLGPLLPKRRTGRPPRDHRTIIDALLWLAKTGAPWRDLPERFGPWRTVATRFYRWTHSGLWERILVELRRMADANGGIDWEVHMIDGTNVRAHRCAAGAKGGSNAKLSAARVAGLAVSCTCAATAGAGHSPEGGAGDRLEGADAVVHALSAHGGHRPEGAHRGGCDRPREGGVPVGHGPASRAGALR